MVEIHLIVYLALAIIAYNTFDVHTLLYAKPKPGKPKPMKIRQTRAAGFLGCEPCPEGNLVAVPEASCNPDFTRISRLAFRKKGATANTEANWELETFWVTQLAASSVEKIVLSPRGKVKRTGFTPGEFERTTDTPDGTERAIAKIKRDKVMFMFENLTPLQFERLLQLFCHDLEVIFATVDNTIWVKNVSPPIPVPPPDPLPAPVYRGFPAYGRVIMQTPVMSQDLTAQPRNFMVEFNLDDVFWYSDLVELKTTFINVL